MEKSIRLKAKTIELSSELKSYTGPICKNIEEVMTGESKELVIRAFKFVLREKIIKIWILKVVN